jgi:hypothetical protein
MQEEDSVVAYSEIAWNKNTPTSRSYVVNDSEPVTNPRCNMHYSIMSFLCNSTYPQPALAFLAGSSVAGLSSQRVKAFRYKIYFTEFWAEQ